MVVQHVLLCCVNVSSCFGATVFPGIVSRRPVPKTVARMYYDEVFTYNLSHKNRNVVDYRKRSDALIELELYTIFIC